MPSAIHQSGPHPALRHLAPTGSECPDCLAMDFGGGATAQQGLTDSCQSGGVPKPLTELSVDEAVAVLQAHHAKKEVIQKVGVVAAATS
ncbi:hypothetical protein CapIbe_005585 [Capra ibex]